MALAVSAFYGACDVVLSPSPASDEALARDRDAGRAGAALGPRRGHLALSTRRCASESRLPGAINVLYSGRITREKGAELLADAFLLRARSRESHACTWCSPAAAPSRSALRERLGEHASFLGWLEGDELARAYASADVFLFPSATDTFGQVILEAQASGLPVIAVARGRAAVADRGPRERPAVRARRRARSPTRCSSWRGSPLLREHLAAAPCALRALRTWERTLERLADGYERVLGDRRAQAATLDDRPVGAGSRAA